MFPQIRLSDYANRQEYEHALVKEWKLKAQAKIDAMSEEEQAELLARADARWDEMFGEKVEPVFQDHANYDVVRHEPWWQRWF